MSFGGFSDIMRDHDRAHSAGYKSLGRNDRDSRGGGRGYGNGLSSGRYRRRQDEARDSNNRCGDRDEGEGVGLGRGYLDDDGNERRNKLNDSDDGGEYNRNLGPPNQGPEGTESQSHGYGNWEREGADGSRGTYGGQGSERGEGLAGDDPSRILGSTVSAGVGSFGKACRYEKSSNPNERDRGSSCQSGNDRVEKSAFGNRVENQGSEMENRGEGSVLNTAASKILSRKSRKSVSGHSPRDSKMN